jgi:hypothetical protein
MPATAKGRAIRRSFFLLKDFSNDNGINHNNKATGVIVIIEHNIL